MPVPGVRDLNLMLGPVVNLTRRRSSIILSRCRSIKIIQILIFDVEEI
jgi:hypothetical protein